MFTKELLFVHKIFDFPQKNPFYREFYLASTGRVFVI